MVKTKRETEYACRPISHSLLAVTRYVYRLQRQTVFLSIWYFHVYRIMALVIALWLCFTVANAQRLSTENKDGDGM